jgi:predicted nuclease of predicted toxin-antitoxin system
MKLLFDQNLSPRLVRLFSDLFPGSTHVLHLGLDTASDEAVWQHATLENFVIVSKDLDFYEPATLRGGPPHVAWVRKGNCTTTEIEAVVGRWSGEIARSHDESSLAVLILY